MTNHYGFETPSTASRRPSHHRELAYRPAGAPRTGLPGTHPFYHRHSTPRPALETENYGYQIPRQAAGGICITPSPTDYVSPLEKAHNIVRPDGYDFGLSHDNYALSPPADSPVGNGVAQYQDELQDPIFDHQIKNDSVLPITTMGGFDEYQQSYYPQPIGRTSSSGSQDLSSNLTVVANNRHLSVPAAREDEKWNPSPRATHPSVAMPINNNIGFFPNHVLSSAPSTHWSFGGNPGSFQTGGGMNRSFDSDDSYMSGPSPPSYSHPNGLPAYPTGTIPVMTATHCVGSWQQQYGSGPPAQVAYQLSQHDFGPFQSLPAQPTYNDHNQMYAQQQHIPTMAPPSFDPGLDRNEFLLKLREHKMSYKDIKKNYPYLYPEAESTLRGRDRACRKAKEQRVRKPNWSADDKRLLREAVVAQIGEHCARNIHTEQELSRSSPQISWKDVGAYITQNGGSYSFAPATSKKMYVKLYCRGSASAATSKTSFSL